MRTHGNSGYTAGCRCGVCREGQRQNLRRYRAERAATGEPIPRRQSYDIGRQPMPVFCRCRAEIESCRGLDNDWMHTAGRSERCPDGSLAVPETPAEMEARRKGRAA